ncbi:ferredoxin [bacterium]
MPTPIDILETKKDEAMKRKKEKNKNIDINIYVGLSTCEIAAGSKDITKELNNYVKKNKLNNISINDKGCKGACYLEPTLEIAPKGKEPILYGKLKAEDIQNIMDSYLKNGKIVEKFLIEQKEV